MKYISDSFKAQVESVLIDYLGIKATYPSFSWENLSGTGSTSVRNLVRVNTGNEELQFVSKRYQIEGQPTEEWFAQAKREYEVMNALAPASSGFWRTPLPIKLLHDHAAIVMEYFPGQNVNALFWKAVRMGIFSLRNQDWMLQLMGDIAKIILNMQNLESKMAVAPVVDESWYITFLEQQIGPLNQFGIEKHKLRRIQRHVEKDINLFFSNDKACFQHTDLTLNNLLFRDGMYCVLDLANTCIGTRYWDISHMIVSLEHYKLFLNVSDRLIKACIEEFSRWFILDPYLVRTMNLIHYSFSLKLSLMVQTTGLKRLLTNDAVRYYEKKIDAILRESH